MKSGGFINIFRCSGWTSVDFGLELGLLYAFCLLEPCSLGPLGVAVLRTGLGSGICHRQFLGRCVWESVKLGTLPITPYSIKKAPTIENTLFNDFFKDFELFCGVGSTGISAHSFSNAWSIQCLIKIRLKCLQGLEKYSWCVRVSNWTVISRKLLASESITISSLFWWFSYYERCSAPGHAFPSVSTTRISANPLLGFCLSAACIYSTGLPT